MSRAATIISGGTETVSSGGTDDGAKISGGTQLDYGLASSTTVFTGSQVVEAGGVASSTTVSSGGTLELVGSATASGFTIGSGGTLEIASGYALSGYTVSSGVTLDVANGEFTVTVPAPTLGVSGRAIALSSLVTIFDAGNVGYKQFEVWDLPTARQQPGTK